MQIGEKMKIKKLHQQLFVTCLFLLLLIFPCLNACKKNREVTKQNLFESIDTYIKNADNSHFAMLAWGSFSFFGTECLMMEKFFAIIVVLIMKAFLYPLIKISKPLVFLLIIHSARKIL